MQQFMRISTTVYRKLKRSKKLPNKGIIPLTRLDRQCNQVFTLNTIINSRKFYTKRCNHYKVGRNDVPLSNLVFSTLGCMSGGESRESDDISAYLESSSSESSRSPSPDPILDHDPNLDDNEENAMALRMDLGW